MGTRNRKPRSQNFYVQSVDQLNHPILPPKLAFK